MRYAKILILTAAIVLLALPPMAQENYQQSNGRAKLEQQLWQIEQDWLKAEQEQKMDYLKDLFSDQFFNILPGGVQISREDMLKRLANRTRKPGAGGSPDSFKLQAVYGNVALATAHTTVKGLGPADGEYRALRMFAKENGKWKVAGAVLVRIAAP